MKALIVIIIAPYYPEYKMSTETIDIGSSLVEQSGTGADEIRDLLRKNPVTACRLGAKVLCPG